MSNSDTRRNRGPRGADAGGAASLPPLQHELHDVEDAPPLPRPSTYRQFFDHFQNSLDAISESVVGLGNKATAPTSASSGLVERSAPGLLSIMELQSSFPSHLLFDFRAEQFSEPVPRKNKSDVRTATTPFSEEQDGPLPFGTSLLGPWHLVPGIDKHTGTRVTLFFCVKKSPGFDAMIRREVLNLTKIRHPRFLSVKETLRETQQFFGFVATGVRGSLAMARMGLSLDYLRVERQWRELTVASSSGRGLRPVEEEDFFCLQHKVRSKKYHEYQFFDKTIFATSLLT